MFMQLRPSLQKLELVVNGERAVPWKILGTHLPWLEPRSLRLRGIALLEDDLVDFATNHIAQNSSNEFCPCTFYEAVDKIPWTVEISYRNFNFPRLESYFFFF